MKTVIKKMLAVFYRRSKKEFYSSYILNREESRNNKLMLGYIMDPKNRTGIQDRIFHLKLPVLWKEKATENSVQISKPK